METHIDKANKISTLINGWGKILFVVGSAIGACFFFYYQVQSNESNIKALQIQLDDKDISYSREFELWEERSDRRYDRAMKTADVLLKTINNNKTWLLDIEKRLSKLEGRLEFK